MKLYFSPFACSLASRIALIEGELDAEFVMVEPGKPLPDGRPYAAVSPLGHVPALETPGGLVLSEGPAVLQYIADLAPEGVLAPANWSDARYRVQMWLNYVATELHKGVFMVLFDREADPDTKSRARQRAVRVLGVLERHLEKHEFLEGGFSIADAYLLAVLNWCEYAGVDIADWPVLLGYRTRLRRRPSVRQAMAEEKPLYEAA